MCGIAGWVAVCGNQPDAEILDSMVSVLSARGPDASGSVLKGRVALAHRRLAVLDLSAASNQPMWDRDGRYLLIYNGEIYNYKEIRAELENCGVLFHTSGDAEVLLESYKMWGTQSLKRFNGMFAFAIWDAEQQTLFMARDRIGKKPLYYATLPNGDLIFASETGALLRHPLLDSSIDPLALAYYLQLNYAAGSRCLVSGILSLPPGCFAVLKNNCSVTVSSYWDLAACFRDKRYFRTDKEASEELSALIDDAVRIRQISDVPLGAFLSGGIDSSTIVASMLKQVHAPAIQTFSSGFSEGAFDESGYAEAIAQQLGLTLHHTQKLNHGDIDLLDGVMAAAAEPIADTSFLPLYFLSQYCRKHVTVVLTGDGGDECFAGYDTYVADKLHSYLRKTPRLLIGSASRIAGMITPVNYGNVSCSEKVRRFLSASGFSNTQAHASWRSIYYDSDLSALMQPEWRGMLSTADLYAGYFEKHFSDVSGCHFLDQACYVDMKTWLADSVLAKVDRATMAHSLEARSPLLDFRVVEFAARLVPEMKLRGYKKKYILKQSQKEVLPAWVLNRKKQGFNAPVSQWFLGPFKEPYLDIVRSKTFGEWFDCSAAERLWEDHSRGKCDNGLKMYGLLTLGFWLQFR